jgi:nicotinate-nucleotide--dimethylbenzimidazole phosphoribosyltransferase
MAHEVISVDGQSDCLCEATAAEHVVSEEHVVLEQTIGHDDVEHGVEHAAVAPSGRVEDSVVVHGPTMVVDAAPAQPAVSAAEPSSVVAQPMPVAAAGRAVLPTPTIAQEPIPTLKPAIAPQSPVAPASNEQPMPEPQATAGNDAADDAAAPMPAPAEDLAGGPTMKLPMQPPKEPNLFDLYDDEGDDNVATDEDMPSEEAPVDSKPATADDDAGEPAEDSEAEATATDEPEMTDAEATDAEATEEEATEEEATDGDSDTAEPDASAEEPAADDATEEADAAPKAEAEQAEADPAEAAVTVPNEPMRRWSDASNKHHTEGWLVEVRADRVRILKVNGRHTTVLTESLSAADRDYVSAVGDRMAAQQQDTSPAPSTTAGL